MTRLSWRRVKRVSHASAKQLLDFRTGRSQPQYHKNKLSKCCVNQDSWTPFNIERIQHESHNARRFVLELPSMDHRFGVPIASAFSIRGFDETEDNSEFSRKYTAISDTAMRGYVEFVAKLYPHGKMSRYLSTRQEGDQLEVRGPFMKIEYPLQGFEHIAMIAGGTGITPMVQLLKEIAMHEHEDKRTITLVNANITEDDMLCRSDLMSLKMILGDRLIIQDFFESPKYGSIQPSSWNPTMAIIGRVSQESLRSILPKPSATTKILVCGPPPMMDALCGEKQDGKVPLRNSGMLKQLGYDMIHNVFNF